MERRGRPHFDCERVGHPGLRGAQRRVWRAQRTTPFRTCTDTPDPAPAPRTALHTCCTKAPPLPPIVQRACCTKAPAKESMAKSALMETTM